MTHPTHPTLPTLSSSSLLRGHPASERPHPGAPDPGRRMPAAARTVLTVLSRISIGTLELRLPDGKLRHVGRPDAAGPVARIDVGDWQVFRDVLARGDVGFAEAWIEGRWQTPNLPALLDLLVANRGAIDASVYGSGVARWIDRLRHLLNRNSRRGARRNIGAHYDLGNAFYRIWLDPGMTYSSALFDGQQDSLESAQDAKYARILDQLALPPGARILEIGCGWGGFAARAAADGLDVTGLTLSGEQLRFAQDRLATDPAAAGRARVRLEDYRDHRPGRRYDGVASIEMFEAVGERYWPAWFDAVARQLAPGGRAVVQTITIDDALFDRYRRGTDFIQQYVFPGGMLPSPEAFEAQARRAGLRIIDRYAFGQDYAATLRHWRSAFTTRLDAVRAMGFDDRFIRLWTFYLAYCEAAFRHRNTDVMHFTLCHDAG